MGEIVGVGLLSHVPTIMLDKETRLELNQGKEISFIEGFARLKAEVFDQLRPETVIILDSHWATTVEFVVASHEQRTGFYTSEELPRGMSSIPYNILGNPALANLIAEEVNSGGSWCSAINNEYLPIHYPTINTWTYLGDGQRWVNIGLTQTGEPNDFRLLGEGIRRAVDRSPGTVVIIGSGGMSHRFHSLSELRNHEASDPIHVHTPEARLADEARLEWMKAGDHRRVIETMEDYKRFAPEGRFGHYLAMIAAVGGVECVVTGELFSEYENSVGTGQVHVWFERPEHGWSSGQSAATERMPVGGHDTPA